MTDYRLGTTYRKGHIDVAGELIPQHASFNCYEGEQHVFEERVGKVHYGQIAYALETGTITEFDKTILSLVATFASCFVTSKAIREMLTMMGIGFSANILESSLKRLHRFHLINFSRFVIPGRAPANMRMISLTYYGSNLAKSLGVPHRFNAVATATATAPMVKARAATVHLICNYLKNLPVESFAVRPVIVVNPDEKAIVRPAASIKLWGSQLCFEVPRRHGDWLGDLIEKLNRYLLVFTPEEMPTIVINGEDEAMNREIAAALAKEDIAAEILYTDDLAMYGTKFRYSLYSFDENGEKVCFEIAGEEQAS